MSKLKRQFEELGFVVIKNLLNTDEVVEYKSKLQKVSGLDDKKRTPHFQCPNGVSTNREFWPLIWHPNLLSSVREIFGDDIRYTQHSDLHVHRGEIGWHRDSADRTYGVGEDWDETNQKYQVARIAIYLQSYAESNSSLVVIPGSHQREYSLSPLEKKVWNRLYFPQRVISKTHPWLQSFVRTDKPKYFMQPPTQPVYLKTEPGDCVIFNTRLIHSGSPIKGPKYAIFLSYGANNQHAKNHLNYYTNTRQDLDYQVLDSQLKEQLVQKNLLMEV